MAARSRLVVKRGRPVQQTWAAGRGGMRSRRNRLRRPNRRGSRSSGRASTSTTARRRKRRPHRALLRIRLDPFGFDRLCADTAGSLADGAGELGETTLCSAGLTRAASAGGTVATMVELMQLASGRSRRCGGCSTTLQPQPRPDCRARSGASAGSAVAHGRRHRARAGGLWIVRYLMALYNTRCVRRTNALLNWAYGRRFRYTETLSMGSSFAAPAFAAMVNVGLASASRFGGGYLRVAPSWAARKDHAAVRHRLRRRVAGSLQGRDVHDHDDAGRGIVATMTQQGDPGYAATAVLLGESAITLACHRDRLPDRRGVLTPVCGDG